MNGAQTSVATLWPSRPFQVVVQADDGREWTTRVNRPYARVGALPHMEVVLPGKEDARRGLYLHSCPDGIYCLSLERSPSREYSPNGWLASNSRIRLGQYRVRAEFADGLPTLGSPRYDLRSPWTNSTRTPYVVVRTKTGAAREPIDRPLTILGSQRPSKIRLDHASISGTHCVLHWDQTSLWAVDLHSSRGTLLDGDSIDASRLRPGQVLTLGTIEIQIELVGTAEAATQQVAEGRYLSSREISNDEALERLLRHFKGRVKRDA